MKSSSESNFQLLLALPREILQERILTKYCDGKAVSTLMLALCCCRRSESATSESESSKPDRTSDTDGQGQNHHHHHHHHYDLFKTVIPLVCRQKLLRLASLIQECNNGNSCAESNNSCSSSSSSSHDGGGCCGCGAVEWIRSIADVSSNHADTDTDTYHSNRQIIMIIRKLSENMAVYDFINESLMSQYSDLERSRLEWPVWYGRIAVEAYVTGTRLVHDAKVVLTCPIQERPRYIPGSSLISNHTPFSKFQCEPYNMVPVPPWGTIRPLLIGDSSDDDRTLQRVGQRLEESNQVGVVPRTTFSGLSQDVLDIRIITKRQARRRRRQQQQHSAHSSGYNMQQLSLLDDDDDGDGNSTSSGGCLLYCWQDDDSAELNDDRDYVQYIMDLMKAKQRLLLENNDEK